MNKTESVAESLDALQKGDLQKAVSLSSDCSGSEGSLYLQDTVSIVRTILEDDYTPDARLKEGVLAPMRVVAAAIELWGVEEASQYAEITGAWNYRYNPAMALKLLHAAGLEKHRLDWLANRGIREVKLSFSNARATCAKCRAMEGKVFPIGEAPSLPLADCAGDPPCVGHYRAARTAPSLLA